MEAPLIEFVNVTKRFEDLTVLDGINLTIYEGDITTIIGKSGSGKSVLLKHIIGLLTPDSGTILFRGKAVNSLKMREWDKYKKKISYLFQNNALFDSMNVFDNVALPLRRTTNLKKKVISEKVMARLEQTDLAEEVGKYPSELSGGMQKRVALARALVTDPQIVLFDEPTTGQDPIRKNAILSMIAQYKRRLGFTAVLISHDIPDVFFISDRILLLWEGKIAFQGTYEEMTGFRHPMLDEYLQSLEGLYDELTGLLSKQMFRSRYDLALYYSRMERSMTAVLFSVEFELLEETIGPHAASVVLRLLGEYISTHLNTPGAFSTRQGRDQILTILPFISVKEAEQLVSGLADGLQQKALQDIQTATRSKVGVDACFEIHIRAGIIEAESNEAIDDMIRKAKADQKVIATYLCTTGGVKT